MTVLYWVDSVVPRTVSLVPGRVASAVVRSRDRRRAAGPGWAEVRSSVSGLPIVDRSRSRATEVTLPAGSTRSTSSVNVPRRLSGLTSLLSASLASPTRTSGTGPPPARVGCAPTQLGTMLPQIRTFVLDLPDDVVAFGSTNRSAHTPVQPAGSRVPFEMSMDTVRSVCQV